MWGLDRGAEMAAKAGEETFTFSIFYQYPPYFT